MKIVCKKAKEWLNRNYNAHKQLDADRRTLEIMENRLQSGVARYESDGTEHHDADQAKARHDDALLDYSIQKAKVEKEERRLVREMVKTRKAIDGLSDPEQKAVAIDRYINRLRWEDIAKLEHVSIAKVYRLNAQMLEKMAEILKFKY